MDKIAQIIDESYRTGTNKKGGPWTLMKIRTEGDKNATCFAPAQIGDPVQLEYNEQYKSYSATVMTGKKMEEVVKKEKEKEFLMDLSEKMDEVLEILKNIKKPDPDDYNMDEIPFK